MNFFRRLQVPPNPMHQTYTAVTGRTVQDAVGDVATADQLLVPIDLTPWQPIFAAMAFQAENPGVPDHATPGFPAPTTTDGHLQ